MSLRQWPMFVPLITLLLIAAIFDTRERRIPNWLTATLVLTGWFSWLISSGLGGVVDGFLGMLAGAAGPMVLYCLGGMRAGDVKLMAGVGSWLGVKGGLIVFLSACVVAMLASIGRSVVRGELMGLLLNSWELGRASLSGRGELARWRSIDKPMPFAAMVLVATLSLFVIQMIGKTR